MQFTVKQQKGKDSTVKIRKVTMTGWPEDKKILIFETDQSLSSQSDRAWNVHKAIENYAHPKGYHLDQTHPKNGKHELVFVYNAHHHSTSGEFEIRTKVQNDERYQDAAEVAKQKQYEINSIYGVAIRQLKNLTFALEKKNDEELERIKQELIDIQVSLVQEIDIPEYVQDFERKRLLEPNYPYTEIKADNTYNYHGQRDIFPDSINRMLKLL